MIRYSQSNDLSSHELQRNRSMNFSTLSPTGNNELTDEIDAILKQEHEDVILLDHSLSGTSLELDFDSISDLLDNAPSTESTAMTNNYTQPLNINDNSISVPTMLAHSQSNANTSAYSSLGISPQFTSLSIHPQVNIPLFQFLQQRPISIPEHDSSSMLATSYPLPLPTFSYNSSDVKRFRSASMNETATHRSKDLDHHESYRHKSSNHTVEHLPQANSFVELQSNGVQMSSFLDDSPGTLFALNQQSRHEMKYPINEIKDESSSPNNTIEPFSETDHWSDIEQNSSDPLRDNGLSSDDDTDVQHDPNGANAQMNNSLFWQYNVQSKGPKTKRILYLKERDPHIYREFSDPVYQIKLTQSKGQVVNKLRKGDGNDVTPNPNKLYQLGKQIRDLSSNPTSVYHGIYHVDHQINSNDTAEVKKEKNKLASRACRLRKKAQHEANKLKLHGLNEEHRGLIETIASIKLVILQRYENLETRSSLPALEMILDDLIASKCGKPVAGNTDGFVQEILNEMEQMHSSEK